jgi:hypothetical protein
MLQNKKNIDNTNVPAMRFIKECMMSCEHKDNIYRRLKFIDCKLISVQLIYFETVKQNPC